MSKPEIDFTDCARVVEKADPERFMAAMAAPVSARQVLFPLYAFNAEVARAPWVTEEAMIAEMRLQWWRDALDEMASGAEVRRHEVTTPLAQVMDAQGAKELDQLVAVRRWDIYKDAFEDEGHFQEYFRTGGAALIWQAARLLGAPEDAREAVLDFGAAVAVSRYLEAIPALEAAGRVPLLDGTREGIAELARTYQEAASTVGQLRKALPKSAHAALLEGWCAAPILGQVAAQPERVMDGTVGISPIRKKLRLLRWS